MAHSLAFLFMVFLALGAVVRLVSFRRGRGADYGPMAFGAGGALAVFALLYWAAPWLSSDGPGDLAPAVWLAGSLPAAALAFAAFVVAHLAVTWWADVTGYNDQDDP